MSCVSSLWRSEPSTQGRRTILLTPCHWCPGLRPTDFKSPLARLGCTVVIVIVLLGQTVTDVGIESSSGPCTHCLQHLRAQAPLKASNLLSNSVHKLCSVTSKVVESIQVLFHSLGPLRQLHELSDLHLHQTRRNIVSRKAVVKRFQVIGVPSG